MPCHARSLQLQLLLLLLLLLLLPAAAAHAHHCSLHCLSALPTLSLSLSLSLYSLELPSLLSLLSLCPLLSWSKLAVAEGAGGAHQCGGALVRQAHLRRLHGKAQWRHGWSFLRLRRGRTL